ncbi:MAG: cyclase [Acidobacteria bacterium]|nr:cyclase [Acidobacteriota bacterium]|tara:strand:- start:717 stop:1700 length:984 start_codon:yes stop_codon:yes gene_type:complete
MTRRAVFIIATWSVIAGVVGCGTAVDSQEPRRPRSVEEFDAMFQELNNWGRWGADDQLGTMNLVTPEKTREAAALVESGRTVSLSHNPMKDEFVDNPDAAFNHTMGRTFRSDTFEFTYHGYGVSHIDSLCHFLWNDRMYNDIDPAESSPEGCGKLGIENLKQGIITRGILLDFPQLQGVDYLEPQTPIYIEDIEAWEEMAGVQVSPGDAIFIRTGRWALRAEQGPFQVSGNSAGLHASVLPWIKERGVALVGSDVATDVMPSMVDGVGQPVHTMLIAGFGTNIFDNMDLEALAEAAAEEGRWEFMLTAGPIPVDGGTGSPLNPIAVF